MFSRNFDSKKKVEPSVQSSSCFLISFFCIIEQMDYILLNIFCWVAHGPHSNHSRGWYWKEIFKRGVVQSVPCRDTDKAKPHLKN